MGANIRMVTGIIRAGSQLKEYGDPYEFAATVVIVADQAYIMGAAGKFTRQMFYDIKFQLANMGVTKVHWDRLKSSKQVTVETTEGL